MTINLGDTVEDKISGFSGIAIARHEFIYGATSISVQPLIEHYGDLPAVESFAIAQLKVTKDRTRDKLAIVKIKET